MLLPILLEWRSNRLHIENTHLNISVGLKKNDKIVMIPANAKRILKKLLINSLISTLGFVASLINVCVNPRSVKYPDTVAKAKATPSNP